MSVRFLVYHTLAWCQAAFIHHCNCPSQRLWGVSLSPFSEETEVQICGQGPPAGCDGPGIQPRSVCYQDLCSELQVLLREKNHQGENSPLHSTPHMHTSSQQPLASPQHRGPSGDLRAEQVCTRPCPAPGMVLRGERKRSLFPIGMKSRSPLQLCPPGLHALGCIWMRERRSRIFRLQQKGLRLKKHFPKRRAQEGACGCRVSPEVCDHEGSVEVRDGYMESQVFTWEWSLWQVSKQCSKHSGSPGPCFSVF